MLRVLTVVGTRPEVIRLSRVIAKLDRHCEHVLVHTGQNYDYELNAIFFAELGVRAPDEILHCAGEGAAETMGKVIMAADRVLAERLPDALLILGDTNSSLAALAAKRRKVPIFHMEAGNRCFDFRVPEEINRRVVDHIADINLAYSDIARENLLREGLPPAQVIKTGSPMYEVLHFHRGQIEESGVLARLGLQSRKYFVVSCHREENVDAPGDLARIGAMLNAVAERYGLPIIFSTHPRTRKAIEQSQLQVNALVQFHRPFGLFDFVKLETEAFAVLSDSGTITEESSILNFPALNLRDSHERPEGMEEGAVMMVGLDAGRVLDALPILDSQARGGERSLRLVADYGTPNVSDKIVRIIHSYVDYVNRVVWHK